MVDMRRIWTIFILLFFALPARAGLELYAVHSDHLGTPRMITDKAQQVVWRASQKPFGEMKVEVEDITYHQRFPGQRFDIESRLHYNYFRDYDPTLGRYIQADPIGLIGGPNLYEYARSNPAMLIDRLGLDPGQFFESYQDAFSDANQYQFDHTGGVGQYNIRSVERDGCKGYTYDWHDDRKPTPQSPPYYPDPNPVPYERALDESPVAVQNSIVDQPFKRSPTKLERIGSCLFDETLGNLYFYIGQGSGVAADRLTNIHEVKGSNAFKRRAKMFGKVAGQAGLVYTLAKCHF